MASPSALLAWALVSCAHAQFVPQGGQLNGSGDLSYLFGDHSSVALSADGNTALVGIAGDSGGLGAVFAFTRSNGTWSQQGGKLAGSVASSRANQGISAALSADGNTAIFGGPGDNGGAGAAWVFTRSNGAWSEQVKLSGTAMGSVASLGISVGLSADGNTALVGGPGGSAAGAAWVFTRSNGVWSQQGVELTDVTASGAALGTSVALSADGLTAVLGGPGDNHNLGAAWLFTLSGGVWSQQGAKLVGSGAGAPYSPAAGVQQGISVAISADGSTALVGGPGASTTLGAAWVFARSNGVWSQQGGKLVGTAAVGTASQGSSVALSGDGNTALVGGPYDTPPGAMLEDPDGAAWAFTRSNGVWSQFGGKILPPTQISEFGRAVALSADGSTALIAQEYGLTWAYVQPAAPGATAPVAVRPASGSGTTQSMTFTFTDPRGWQDLDVVNVLIDAALDAKQSCYLAYSRTVGVLYLVNDAGNALLPGIVLNGGGGTPTASNSQCTVSAAGSSESGSGAALTLTLNLAFATGFAGDKLTYMAARDIQGGNSGWQPLGVWTVPGAMTFPSVSGAIPGRGVGTTIFTFTFADTKGTQDLGVVNVLVNDYLNGQQACYLAYDRSGNVLYVVNDAGTGLLRGSGPLGPYGIFYPTGNSQCSVTGTLDYYGPVNTLTLNLQMSFSATFTGNRIVYAAARDSTGANNSGWQVVGTVSVQ